MGRNTKGGATYNGNAGQTSITEATSHFCCCEEGREGKEHRLVRAPRLEAASGTTIWRSIAWLRTITTVQSSSVSGIPVERKDLMH